MRLHDARQAEEQLLLDIANAQGTSKALQSKVHAMDVAAIKQQEMLYAIEFVIQGLERKVNDASGKRTVEENAVLKKLLDETRQRMEAEEADSALMDGQVKRLRDETASCESDNRRPPWPRCTRSRRRWLRCELR